MPELITCERCLSPLREYHRCAECGSRDYVVRDYDGTVDDAWTEAVDFAAQYQRTRATDFANEVLRGDISPDAAVDLPDPIRVLALDLLAEYKSSMSTLRALFGDGGPS